MSDIGVGDFVEFVGKPTAYVNPVGGDCGAGFYQPGQAYRVTEVGRQCADGIGQVWDSMRTDRQPLVRGVLTSVPVAAFRPIYRPKQSIIEALKVSELIDEGERSDVRMSQEEGG